MGSEKKMLSLRPSGNDTRSAFRMRRNRRELTQADMERMAIPKRFWDTRFSLISEGTHKDFVETYLRKIILAYHRGYGAILWGDNGCGKTSAAIVMLKAARRLGFSGFFIRSSQYRQDVMDGRRFDDDFSVRERCADVDFLVIDDLGKESSSEKSSGGSERMVEDLVRERTSNLKPTIITVNHSPDDLDSRYGFSVKSLLTESFAKVKMDVPSQRVDGARMLKEFFTEQR